MRRLLPPLALLSVIAICLALGNWQLNRADYKRDLQAQRDQANALAPLAADSIEQLTGSTEGRRVTLRGQWVVGKTIFLDNRTHNGHPGFFVIAPMRLEKSKRVVLVLRGWVAANLRNRTQVPSITSSSDPIELIGYAQRELAQSMQLAAEAEPSAQQRIWQYFDYDKFNRWSGMNVARWIVRQTSDSTDQLVRDWPVAGDGVDRHLGYAFQWFAMAFAAFVFLILLLLKSRQYAAGPRQ